MHTVTDIEQLDLNGTYSYADYLTWRFEERVELIWGKVFRLFPAPSLKHQKVSTALLRGLLAHFEKHTCNVFHAPFDVRLLDQKKSVRANKDIFTVVQPDICVICDDTKLDEQGCLGAPDWIIEILSPRTAKKDLKIKYDLYEQNAVPEYWIVHPNEQYIQAYSLENGKYGEMRLYSEEDRATPPLFPNLQLPLPDIFE
ncbi:MAG: Uma2 family endonuclease [Saprospiraceae bacterium]|jgi:Uma2 family endonuclease|nr:Uma2 family endonuclease [Saprospiraceae bacterium]